MLRVPGRLPDDALQFGMPGEHILPRRSIGYWPANALGMHRQHSGDFIDVSGIDGFGSAKVGEENEENKTKQKMRNAWNNKFHVGKADCSTDAGRSRMVT